MTHFLKKYFKCTPFEKSLKFETQVYMAIRYLHTQILDLSCMLQICGVMDNMVNYLSHLTVVFLQKINQSKLVQNHTNLYAIDNVMKLTKICICYVFFLAIHV